MKAFCSIWLKGVDQRRYAIFRVGFAILMLLHFACILPYAVSLLSHEGISPSSMSAIGFHEITGGISVSIFNLITSPLLVNLAVLLAIIACLLMISGKYSRTSLIYCFIIQLSFIHRAPISTTGWDTIITNICLILIFSPLGENWGLKSLIKNRLQINSVSETPRYGLVLIQMQVFVIYWQTVLQKMGDYYWANGESITYFFLSHHGRFSGQWPVNIHGLLDKINYLTLLTELAIPILLWISKTRKIGLVIGISFHVCIAALGINLFLFSLTMIVSYLAFLKPWEIGMGKYKNISQCN